VPDGIQEWGGAGIVDLCKSVARVASDGRGRGVQHSLSRNGATGREQASTGGGFLGAQVREQRGQEDMRMNNREVPQVVEPEMAPPAHGVMGRPTATEQGVPGGRHSRTQTQAPAPVAVTQPGIDKGNTDEDIWEAATWEDIKNNH
jgi:hypothetical protein